MKRNNITIATATLYPKWHQGIVTEITNTDKIRGDLAIETVKEIASKGYKIVLVDGGSSEVFKTEIKKMKVKIYRQIERGISASRRQAIEIASRIPGVKLICWTEPEKVSLIRDSCLYKAIEVFNHGTDILILCRKAASFNTYPDYQAICEQRGNLLWNNILRKKGLLSHKDKNLDILFGPKIFKNIPSIIELFFYKYNIENHEQKDNTFLSSELWFNASALPIIKALIAGYSVRPIFVSYVHPDIQTKFELNNKEFMFKRKIQFKNLLINTKGFLQDYEN